MFEDEDQAYSTGYDNGYYRGKKEVLNKLNLEKEPMLRKLLKSEKLTEQEISVLNFISDFLKKHVEEEE